MANSSRNILRRVPRWLWISLAVVVVAAAVVNLTGCTAGGIWDRLGAGFGGGHRTPGPGNDSGHPLSALWRGAADSFARIDWWLGLGAGVSILVGVYRALRGDIAGGGGAIAVGVGLVLINAIVAVILPAAFYLAVIGTFVVGGIVAYRLARGRGIGGHSLRCFWARVTSGAAAHRKAHEVEETV